MTTLLDIGDQLVCARRAAGLSQRELADKLGTTQQQIARWEASAYRSVSLGRVAAVAVALEEAVPASPQVAEPTDNQGSPADTEVQRPRIPPARDLGEVAARVRAHGDELRGRFHLDSIRVFGPFACGTQTAGSDVDLLIETADPDNLRFVEAADFMEDILGRQIDVSWPHLLGDHQLGRVQSEAVCVWSA
jgi:uncharacterized protein